MLGSLVYSILLVQYLYTSENGYSVRYHRMQDYQQERLDCMKVTDDYIVGFTEGEGMFYIGIVPSKETRTG